MVSATSPVEEPIEVRIAEDMSTLHIAPAEYDTVVKRSGPPLSYVDEDGDMITVGSAAELRDRISEQRDRGRDALFSLTDSAGHEFEDSKTDHGYVLVNPAVKHLDFTGESTEVVNETESIATPEIADISRDRSTFSTSSTGFSDEVETPDLQSAEDSEEYAQPVAVPSNQANLTEGMLEAFERMLRDTEEIMSRATTPVATDSNQLARSTSVDTLSTIRPATQIDLTTPSVEGDNDLPNESVTLNNVASWADIVSENIKRAILQLQDVAGRGVTSTSQLESSASQDTALADHVAQLVRKIVQEISDDINANNRISRDSNFNTDVLERTINSFQDFAAQIGHVAMIGGYHAAAMSRDAAEIGLQATREAIRAARENTQTATNQLQQCLRDLITQFVETQTQIRSQEHQRSSFEDDLYRQINETWTESSLARSEISSRMTPDVEGYVTQDDRSFSSMATSGPPLPSKTPIKSDGTPPTFGTMPKGFSIPRRTQSYSPTSYRRDDPQGPPPPLPPHPRSVEPSSLENLTAPSLTRAQTSPNIYLEKGIHVAEPSGAIESSTLYSHFRDNLRSNAATAQPIRPLAKFVPKSGFTDLGGSSTGFPGTEPTEDNYPQENRYTSPIDDFVADGSDVWGEVASERNGDTVSNLTEAVRELEVEQDEIGNDAEVSRDILNATPSATTLVPIQEERQSNPWSRFINDEARMRSSSLERSGGHHHHQTSRGDIIEDVSTHPLAGLISRNSSYKDEPGMPPSPKEILREEGVTTETASEANIPPAPSVATYSGPPPSYRSTAESVSGMSAMVGRGPGGHLDPNAASLSGRILAMRRQRAKKESQSAASRERSQYIEMRTLSSEAQERADINRLGLENSASESERQCARQLVELDLISPDNMALAIYYAQQCKGDVVDAIDMLGEDLKQLENFEKQNRPAAGSNPLAESDEDPLIDLESNSED
ncbi:hypothetical protein V1511DRAFT_461104 [Dipodascopsis uninucleata]